MFPLTATVKWVEGEKTEGEQVSIQMVTGGRQPVPTSQGQRTLPTNVQNPSDIESLLVCPPTLAFPPPNLVERSEAKTLKSGKIKWKEGKA